jgi:iron(III) transport system substrate-binding protein
MTGILWWQPIRPQRRMPRLVLCLLLALTWAVLAQPVAARAADPPDEAAKLAAAKKEGKVVWYVSMFDIDTAEQVGKAFEAKYPGVTVDVVRATAGVIYQRVLQESQAGVFADDVFSSTEEGHYLNFKEQKLIRPYVPVDADQVVPRLQHIDPDNTYQGRVGRSGASDAQHAASIAG